MQPGKGRSHSKEIYLGCKVVLLRFSLLTLICDEGCFRYWPKPVAMRIAFQIFESLVPSFCVSHRSAPALVGIAGHGCVLMKRWNLGSCTLNAKGLIGIIPNWAQKEEQ